MQLIYVIIFFFVLVILGAAHLHYREKVGLAPNEARICATTNSADCHSVNKEIVEAVRNQALAIAQADEAETFPIEASDDIDNVYTMDVDSLEDIAESVAKTLGISRNRVVGNHYFDYRKTVNELILFLHFQSKH